jgi:hypothetical protein
LGTVWGFALDHASIAKGTGEQAEKQHSDRRMKKSHRMVHFVMYGEW